MIRSAKSTDALSGENDKKRRRRRPPQITQVYIDPHGNSEIPMNIQLEVLKDRFSRVLNAYQQREVGLVNRVKELEDILAQHGVNY